MNLPIRKSNYMASNYSSSNYGSHSQEITIGQLTLWFSYNTVIGFDIGGRDYFSENCWGKTTGKHLNCLCPDKSQRIKRVVFEKMLNEALVSYKWFSLTGSE